MTNRSSTCERIFLGSTGSQPVAAGSPAGNIFEHAIQARRHIPVSASCRDLQAGSLRSPARETRALPRADARRNFLPIFCIAHFPAEGRNLVA